MAAKAELWPEIETAIVEKRRELKISGQILSSHLEKNKDALPTDFFQRLSALNFLELSQSPRLTVLPAEIKNVTSLTNLVLQGNHLTKLPESMGELTKLKYLDVSRNSLTELFSSIGRCGDLQTLNVAQNQLTDFPTSVVDCQRLSHVDASHNLFDTFPSFLCNKNLQHLSDLSFKSNKIVDIPATISELSALKSLDLEENKIRIVPGELGDCSKLKELKLKNNDLADRRLKKLIDDNVQKSILDYVRKNCPKIAASTKSKKSGNERKKSSKSEEDDVEEKADENDEETGAKKDRIVVLPWQESMKIVWRKNVAEVRPFVLFCLVKNVDFSDPKLLKEFLLVQTKLHDEQCKKRVAATIATHDVSKIHFPLSYTAKPPCDILIHPLGRTKSVTAEDLMATLNAEAEQLRKEKKRKVYSGVHQYLYLLKDRILYPCLIDRDDRVISFPPITNSDITKITPTTHTLLLEVSSDQDMATCKRVMEALLKAIFTSNFLVSDDHVKIMTLEQVKVETEEGALKVVYPSKIDLHDYGSNVEIVRSYAKNENEVE